jgi:hypothetical protein
MSSNQPNKNGQAEESSALRSQLEFFLGGVIPVDSHDDDCTICLDTLDTDVCKVLRCGHCFHITCIIPWFTSDGARRGSCPACRRELYEPAPLNRPRAEPIFPSLQHEPDQPREAEEDEVIYDDGGPVPDDDGEPDQESISAPEEEAEMIDWYNEQLDVQRPGPLYEVEEDMIDWSDVEEEPAQTPTQSPTRPPEEVEGVLYDYGGWSDEEESVQSQPDSSSPVSYASSEMSRVLQQREAEDQERIERRRAEELRWWNNHVLLWNSRRRQL